MTRPTRVARTALIHESPGDTVPVSPDLAGRLPVQEGTRSMSTPQESATLAGNTTAVQTLKIYVGGRWVDSSAKTTFDVHNPALDTVIARTPMGGAEDVDRAVQAALKAYPAWRATPPKSLKSSEFL